MLRNSSEDSFHLHQTINPRKALATVKFLRLSLKTPYRNQPHWLRPLTEFCDRESGRNNTAATLGSHIGRFSTYSHKAELKRYLSLISAALTDNLENIELNASQKKAVATKLTEELSACTPGFMNRVRSIIHFIQRPKTLNEFLASMRLQVIDYASGGEDEVHTHEEFTRVANLLGLAIPFDNIADPYGGVLSQNEIRDRIQDAFDKRYSPHYILLELFKSAFHDLGYRGFKRNESYPDKVYSGIMELLRGCFNAPNLKLEDFFIISSEEETQDFIQGVNWVLLDNFIIEYLESRHYFLNNPALRETQTVRQYEIGNTCIAVHYIAGDILNTRMTYFDSEKKHFAVSYIGACYRGPDEINFSELPNVTAAITQFLEEAMQSDTLEMADLVELTHTPLIAHHPALQQILLEEILTRADSLEDLCYALDVVDESTHDILKNTLREAFNRRVSTVDDFIYLIDGIRSEKQAREIAKLNLNLTRIIQTTEDFKQLLHHYQRSSNRAKIVIELFKPHLAHLIRSVNEFKVIVDEVRNPALITLFSAYKPHFSHIIRSADDYEKLVKDTLYGGYYEYAEVLRREVNRATYDLALDHLLDIAIKLIKRSTCLEDATPIFVTLKTFADSADIAEAYDALKGNGAHLVFQRSRTIAKFVAQLDNQTASRFIQDASQKLSTWIKSVKILRECFHRDYQASDINLDAVFNHLEATIINITRSKEDFMQLIEWLEQTQAQKLCGLFLREIKAQHDEDTIFETFAKHYTQLYSQTWAPSLFFNENFLSQLDHLNYDETWEAVIREATKSQKYTDNLILKALTKTLDGLYFKGYELDERQAANALDSNPAKRARR